jgi:YidC/Oxa1 family membrane protein insertase
MQNENSKNILIACIISGLILIAWTLFYEKPRMESQKQEMAKIVAQQQNKKPNSEFKEILVEHKNYLTPEEAKTTSELSREEAIANSEKERIQIKTPQLHGSINLKGVSFDDLTLVNYKQTLDSDSKEVVLFSPNHTKNKYLVNFGFRAAYENLIGEAPQEKYVDYPNFNTVWKTNNYILTPNNPITLTWQNPQKVTFQIDISVDNNYMFTILQTIKNNSRQDLNSALISEIQHFMPETKNSSYISHEGPIAVFDGILKEKTYVKLRDKKDTDNDFTSQNGWIGLTDKYWLTSIIPDKKNAFETKFRYYDQLPGDLYEVGFASKDFQVKSGKMVSFEQKLFAGAKKVSLLDEYAKQYDIALFDRAIDFGWYYFLTKPFFFILQFFNNLFGNYGLAILAITVLVKLAMFPLANKSYGALAKIKTLQPKIDKIRENYKDKKMQMNKEIMELYKREKVNPVSGCLPMLIQIPVFFSLYKVLYLTIDMRHAPFYGWIKDLSAPDPTSIFNLFGLLPFDTHGILTIGIWPILMGATMFVQQKLNPKPSDPAQAKVMKILPFILIFAFASFPAGLLIYWTWSNTLSILQQWFITRKFDKLAAQHKHR